MRAYSLLIIVSLLALTSGCVRTTTQGQYSVSSTSLATSNYQELNVYGTQIYYRDLSVPADENPQHSTIKTPQPQANKSQGIVAHKSTQRKAITEKVKTRERNDTGLSIKKDNHNDAVVMSKRPTKKNISSPKKRERFSINKKTEKKTIKPVQPRLHTNDGDVVTVVPKKAAEFSKTKRILLKPSKTTQKKRNTQQNRKNDTHTLASNTQGVGFWQWVFGKRINKTKPAPVVVAILRPDRSIVNQPREVKFEHSKTDQLAAGQFETLVALSQYANTTAIYEVRGTAGYLGKTAERIGRERAEFIKKTLIDSGVPRTKIRIMDYDASYPGLRGVVTVRDRESI